MKARPFILVSAFLLGSFFFFFRLGQNYPNRDSAQTVDTQPQNPDVLEEELQTNQSDLADASESLSTTPDTFSNEIDPITVQSGGLTQGERETISIYRSRNEGVVNISTKVIAYNWFLEPVPQEGNTGSGSIIDERGYVLTNYHVVKGASDIVLTLSDNTSMSAEIVGVDSENDLAILYFDPEDRSLSPIPLGSSENLQIGQQVLAIGNPFGLDRTLTIGIVSGLGRPIRTDQNLIINNMIQTDASINPGNSGGPLLDSRGVMVGINTMIYTPSGGSVGVGFAVPVDTARRVIPDLIQFGFVQRGWIDIIPRQIFPRLVEYADLPVDRGILVSQIVRGGNADDAGLKGGKTEVFYGNTSIYLGGDIIIEIDGTPIKSIANFYEALEDNRPGETVNITYIRSDGTRKTTVIILSERPQEQQWE